MELLLFFFPFSFELIEINQLNHIRKKKHNSIAHQILSHKRRASNETRFGVCETEKTIFVCAFITMLSSPSSTSLASMNAFSNLSNCMHFSNIFVTDRHFSCGYRHQQKKNRCYIQKRFYLCEIWKMGEKKIYSKKRGRKKQHEKIANFWIISASCAITNW